MSAENGTYSKIRFRILLPVSIALIAVIVIGIFSAYRYFVNQQNYSLEVKKQRLETSFNVRLETDSQQISGLIRLLKKNKKIEQAWKVKKRDVLLNVSREFYQTFKQDFDITHFYYHDLAGVNFLRVHQPNRHGDKIERISFLQAKAAYQRVYGLELGVFGQFVLRVVEPWYIDGVLAGYIELGKEVDSLSKDIKASVGIEQIIFIDKKLVNRKDWNQVFGAQTSWEEYEKWVMATSTLSISPEIIKIALKQIEVSEKPVNIENQIKKYIAFKVPLTDMGGKQVGFSLLLHDSTIDSIHLRNIIKNMLILGFVIVSLIVSAYFIYIGKIQLQLDTTYAALNKKIVDHQLAEQELRQSSDALKASNQELESYSYSIAHDLRAPLRSITSFSQIIEEEDHDKLSDDGRNNLARIISAGKRMSQLIEDILKLSRITRIELSCQEVDLSIMVNEIKQRLESIYPDRLVEWVIQNDVTIYADARLIERVMENLLGNAIKYTEKFEHARIEFGRIQHTNEVIYYVRDNGIGFDMQYTGKLFGPFQRLHGDEYDGTGIGLATVQRIIHRHGGRVWSEAEVDKGATFYFTLGK